MQSNSMHVHQKHAEPWKVTLVDTGSTTMTGGRLKRVKEYLDSNEDFCFTYGDGVSDVDISDVIKLHKKNKTLATVTAVKPDGRFGIIKSEGSLVSKFEEKPKENRGWINGGFFVLSARVCDLIEDDKTIWEREPMQRLAKNSQMSVYFHEGFWQPMDTLREKNLLEDLWHENQAPWKTWK